jgi:hypothetical protein
MTVEVTKLKRLMLFITKELTGTLDIRFPLLICGVCRYLIGVGVDSALHILCGWISRPEFVRQSTKSNESLLIVIDLEEPRVDVDLVSPIGSLGLEVNASGEWK